MNNGIAFFEVVTPTPATQNRRAGQRHHFFVASSEAAVRNYISTVFRPGDVNIACKEIAESHLRGLGVQRVDAGKRILSGGRTESYQLLNPRTIPTWTPLASEHT